MSSNATRITHNEPVLTSPASRKGAKEDVNGFGDAASFLRRHWRGITVSALTAAGLAAFVAMRLEPLYKSEAQLFVPPGFNSPLEDQGALQARAEASYLDSQIYIIQSSNLLLQVVDALSLAENSVFAKAEPGPIARVQDRIRAAIGLVFPASDAPLAASPTEQTAERRAMRKLRQMVEVARQGSSYVISISVLAPQPDLAATLANAVASAYIEQTLDRRSREFRQSAEWLTGQAVDLQGRLQRAERAVEDFRAQNGLLGGVTGSTLNQQQLTEINIELIRTRAALAERRAALDIAEQQVSSDVYALAIPESLNSEIMNDLRTQLLAARRDRISAAERPGRVGQIEFIDVDIAELENQIRSEVARIINSLRTDVRTVETREQLLQSELEAVGGQTQVDQRVSVELRALEREAATLQDLYQLYLARSQITQEAASFVGSAPAVVSQALEPVEPVFPPKKFIVAFGLLMGAGLYIALMLLRTGLRGSFTSAAELEAATGVHVSGQLPRHRKKRRFFSSAPSAQRDDFAEAARALRLDLAPYLSDVRAPLVLVSAARSGDGSTTTVLALAESAATVGKRVLIVDAGDQEGTIAQRLPVIAAHDREIKLPPMSVRSVRLTRGDVGQLSLLQVPRASAGSPMPIETPAFAAAIAEARQNFDLILVDAPPVLDAQDTLFLSRQADIVLVSVRWKSTPRSALQETLALFGGANTRLVLNSCKRRRPRR